MKKDNTKNKSVTICGALSPTGVGAKLDPKGGGPISKGKDRNKKTKKFSGMTTAESIGDLGEGTHHVGP